MTSKEVKRRELLLWMAKLGVSLPLLPSLSVRASASNSPKRFIVMFTSNGQQAPHWYPRTGSPMRQMGARAKGFSLGDVPGPVSEIFGSEFNKYKPKINLVRGLDIVPVADVRDHWSMKLLSGFGTQYVHHRTIDQVMSNSSSLYANEPKIRSLHLQVPGSSDLPSGYLSYSERNGVVTPIVPINSPAVAVERLFSKTILDQKVLSLVSQKFSEVRTKKLLSGEDRLRLGLHMELLAEMRQKTVAKECPGEVAATPNASTDQTLDDYVNLIAATVKCDLSRVILLNMTECADAKAYSFLPGVGYMGFHNMTHNTSDPSVMEQLKIVNRYHGSKVLKLMDLLNEVEDANTGATYLDNSLILWGSEQSVKFNEIGITNGHNSEDMPVFLAGGCGGKVKTGRFLDYRQPNRRKRWSGDGGLGTVPCPVDRVCEFDENFPGIGIPLNELLITIMSAMGLDSSEWESSGAIGFGDYSQNVNEQYAFGDKRTPIAELYNPS
jgi:hypothetical protein